MQNACPYIFFSSSSPTLYLNMGGASLFKHATKASKYGNYLIFFKSTFGKKKKKLNTLNKIEKQW